MSDEIRMDVPYFQVPNWLFDDCNLKSIEKLVLIYLCRCGNHGGEAFPSYATIGDKCGISRRTAISAVKVLVNEGYIDKNIRWEEKDGEQASYGSNLYQINTRGVVQEIHHGGAGDAPYKEQLIKNNYDGILQTVIDYFLAKHQEKGIPIKPISNERWEAYKERLKAAIIYKGLKEGELLEKVDRFFDEQKSFSFSVFIWSLGVYRPAYRAHKFKGGKGEVKDHG